ncbi:RNA polymerase sigma factor ShbA [Actinokineospora sp. HUAS TT18]|uniref:RNA polymerase sigma factor ShbA n=1 Tax=Actinokineospora sp. HUAS TT18 TaxID=3447451 RepID=UPI003F51FE05
MLCTVELDDELAELEASLRVTRPRPPVDRHTIDEAVSAAIAGDARATQELLVFLRPLVVRYCRAKLGRLPRSFSSPDDVAQEVCVAVFRALPSYQQLGRPFLSFVYGIAAHKIADVHRANTRDKSDPTAEAPDVMSLEDGPEQITLRHELAEQTGALLRILTQRQRDILVMRIVMGMSAQETANAIGTTAEAIRVAQHRALNRLRKQLAA